MTGEPLSPRATMAERCAPARRRSAGGFSLIELLIVMTIIAILATAAIPQIFDATQRAEEAVLRQDLHILRDAIDQYRADNDEYPQRLEDLAAGAYVREIPEDPITDSRDTWVVVRADWELLEEGERPGIWDVRSGAPGVGLDGTEYRLW